ncbi:MAG: YeeE/YedE thiosulfate transporter family protein [Aestuariivita sp.]|uniref:YeeE/YedE family protein n=1 Tax=Aestuariivita sp. TaxID=1872407 RepID=UPI003BAFBBFB
MEQDWIMGLIGGVLIGLGAATYLLGNGRIMGASGIIGGLIDGSGRSTAVERLVFLAGLVGMPAILMLMSGAEITTNLTSNWVVVAIAGLLVGVGTRIANGCTSGHGVCGISRFSLRGIVATLVYLLAGGAMLVVMRHVAGII